MKPFLSSVLLVVLALTASAQTLTNPPSANVESLVTEALTQNPELRFYEAELTDFCISE